MSALAAVAGFFHETAPQVEVNWAASRPKKRQTCQQDGSRARPIIIDNPDSPNQRASDPEPFKKKQRMNYKREKSFQQISTSAHDLNRVQELLKSRKRVVIITGAGISANAGVPTFQEMRKSKETSFCRSLYSCLDQTVLFHSTICSMLERLQLGLCQPTPFHKTMDKLARAGQLLHHFTQNIDCIEQQLPDLDTKTFRLHGQVDQVRCQICNGVFELQPRHFRAAQLPDCEECVKRSQARVLKGKRALRVGKLQPDVLLYGEPCPDNEGIFKTVKHDLAICPDLVLVVGTKLETPGALEIATSFCHAAQSRNGFAVWISKEGPTARVQNFFDYIIKGDCDAVTQSTESLHLINRKMLKFILGSFPRNQ